VSLISSADATTLTRCCPMTQCFQCDKQFEPDGTSGDLCFECASKVRSELGLTFQLRQTWGRWRTHPTRFPLVTLFLISVMVGIYLFTVRGPIATDALESMLEMDTWKILHGQVWRLVTASFLHLRLDHLIGNVVCLLVVGPLAEALFGHLSLLILWLATGTAGSVAQLLGHAHPVTGYGASTAAYGLLGALLIAYLFRQVPLSKRSRFTRASFLAAFTMINLFGEWFLLRRLTPAHVGGLVSGLLLALVVPLRAARMSPVPSHSPQG
jgi:membrane associated rhomboid family serine protease